MLTAAAVTAACAAGSSADKTEVGQRRADVDETHHRSEPLPLPTEQGGGLLLPDLRALPTASVYVIEAEQRQLRFSTTVANTGDGPLDLTGRHDATTGVTTASQGVVGSDGTAYTRVAGEFVYSDGHDHWHFVDFTVTELWAHDGNGALTQAIASTGKATFCAIDSEIGDQSALRASPEPAYTGCDAGIQGISVGWQDTYEPELRGQELNITGLPEGSYALRTIVDPAQRILETDDTNNEVVSYVLLAEAGAAIVAAPP